VEKPRYPSDEAEKFMLRLVPGLRDQLAAVAKQGGRSMNTEINTRLQQSFEGSAAAWLPPDLYQRLNDAAIDSGRSLAAEMIHRLESTFSPQRELFSREDVRKLVNAAIDERLDVERQKSPPAKKRLR
jgi:hypothetical protein